MPLTFKRSKLTHEPKANILPLQNFYLVILLYKIKVILETLKVIGIYAPRPLCELTKINVPLGPNIEFKADLSELETKENSG